MGKYWGDAVKAAEEEEEEAQVRHRRMEANVSKRKPAIPWGPRRAAWWAPAA